MDDGDDDIIINPTVSFTISSNKNIGAQIVIRHEYNMRDVAEQRTGFCDERNTAVSIR